MRDFSFSIESLINGDITHLSKAFLKSRHENLKILNKKTVSFKRDGFYLLSSFASLRMTVHYPATCCLIKFNAEPATNQPICGAL